MTVSFTRKSKAELIAKAGELAGGFVKGLAEATYEAAYEQATEDAASIVTSVPEPEKVEVPDGYELLPAGPTRYVGVNTAWLQKKSGIFGGPIHVEDENGDKITWFGFDEVKILGEGKLVGWEFARYCGIDHHGNRSVRVETTAALLVKTHRV